MSYLQRFPYEQLRQLQSDVETLTQLVATLTTRFIDATQDFVPDNDTPLPTNATFPSLTCATLSLLDDNGDPHDVETELEALAPLPGAAFTGNVSVAGTLTQGGNNVLTTQYTPPVTDLSACAKLAGAAFTGNVSVGGTLSQGGYNVLTTQYTPPATDLSACAKLGGAAFTGNVSVGGTLSQGGYSVHPTSN